MTPENDNHKHARVLFIGWDGAEPRIVNPLLASSRLPNLAALIRQGFIAPLPSTIRPESPTAWTTFATATNPGTHGVYGFMRQIAHSYSYEFTNSNHVRVPFFWETLSLHGKRVALLNMPMAYPPRPVNGWLVCGLMTPDSDSPFTYPAKLGRELIKQGYTIDAEPLEFGEERGSYVEKMHRQVRQRVVTAKDLLRNMDWDFGAVVFTELDRLQHFFWADMDAQHPLHPTEVYTNAIGDHYVELDRALGELVSMVGPDTLVILMSDHGFAPCAQRFYINAWLVQQGYIKITGTFGNNKSRLVKLISWAKKQGVLRRVKRSIVGTASVVRQMESHFYNQQVDWQHTRAWFADTEGIRVNLYGREPQGVVREGNEYNNLLTELSDKLLNIYDPKTHSKVIKAVYHNRDIYTGPELDLSPDLIVEPFRNFDNLNDNYWIESQHYGNYQTLYESSAPYSANHSSNGVCASNAMPPFPIKGIDDVSRWIMNYCGVDVDPVITRYDTRSDTNAFDAQSEQHLSERLRKLGYID